MKNFFRPSVMFSTVYKKSGVDTLGLYDDTGSEKKRVSNSL